MDGYKKRIIKGIALISSILLFSAIPISQQVNVNIKTTKTGKTIDSTEEDIQIPEDSFSIKEKNEEQGNKLKCTFTASNNQPRFGNGDRTFYISFYDLKEAIEFAKKYNVTRLLVEVQNDLYIPNNMDISGLDLIIIGNKQEGKSKLIFENSEKENEEESSIFYTKGNEDQLFELANIEIEQKVPKGEEYPIIINDGDGRVYGYYIGVDAENFSTFGGKNGECTEIKRCNIGDLKLDNVLYVDMNGGNYGNISISSGFDRDGKEYPIEGKTIIYFSNTNAGSINVDISGNPNDNPDKLDPSSYLSFRDSNTDSMSITGCASVKVTGLDSDFFMVKNSCTVNLYNLGGKTKKMNFQLDSVGEAFISDANVDTIKCTNNNNVPKSSISISDTEAYKAEIEYISNLSLTRVKTIDLITKKIDEPNSGRQVFLSMGDSTTYNWEIEGVPHAYTNNSSIFNINMTNSNLTVTYSKFPPDYAKNKSFGTPRIDLDATSTIELDGCQLAGLDICFTPIDDEFTTVYFKEGSIKGLIKLIRHTEDNDVVYYLSSKNPAYDINWDGYNFKDIPCWDRDAKNNDGNEERN